MTQTARVAHAHDQRHDAWDYFWKDDNGKVVIYQRPNIYLIGWIIVTVISLFTEGSIATILGYVGSGLLIIWALLEIFKGVNYFRRTLGVIVLAWSLFSVITTIF